MSHILLASRSPRRRKLLEEVGFQVHVKSMNVPEQSDYTTPPDIARDLAIQKGVAVVAACAPDVADVAFTLSADTVVWDQAGNVYGKPRDKRHATTMLHALMGTPHFVTTAFALFRQNETPVHVEDVTTKVFMHTLSDASLASYLETDEPWDKAGAYGIQGLAGTFISHIEGSWHAVVGLPIYHVLRAAKSSELIDHMPWEKST